MMAATSALARALPFGPPRVRRRWMVLPATASDADLVGHARGGDPEAVARLVERYSPRLFRYVLRWLADEALAEDILQDTWLRVMERLESYNPKHPFAAWLFAVARHRAIDALRQRAREARLLGRRAEPEETDEGGWLEPLDTVPTEDSSPLEQLADAELEGSVADAFARLPRHYREVLTLRFHEDLRLEEIARILGLPLSTVKTRVQRGLGLVRRRAEGLGWRANE